MRNEIAGRVSMRELGAALFPPAIREEARFVTLFSTYLDASKEGPENVYALAGFIARQDRWDDFNEAWVSALAEFGLKHFHMKDFEGTRAHGGFGGFEGWRRDDPRRVPLLTSLVKVLNLHTDASVAFSMSGEMYNKYIEQRIDRAIQHSPYYFVFLNLLVNTEKLMDDGAKANVLPFDWQMAYLLARGDEGAGAVLQAFNANTPAVKDVLKISRTITVALVDGENFNYPALEAADLLAYEVRKQVGKQIGANQNQDARRLFSALEEIRRPKRWGSYSDEIGFFANMASIEHGLFGKNPDLWIPPRA